MTWRLASCSEGSSFVAQFVLWKLYEVSCPVVALKLMKADAVKDEVSPSGGSSVRNHTL